MKINLTKLLESTRARFINQEPNSAACNFVNHFDFTSPDRVYAFELENEQFDLEDK